MAKLAAQLAAGLMAGCTAKNTGVTDCAGAL